MFACRYDGLIGQGSFSKRSRWKAQSTQGRVPGVHTAAEASRELERSVSAGEFFCSGLGTVG